MGKTEGDVLQQKWLKQVTVEGAESLYKVGLAMKINDGRTVGLLLESICVRYVGHDMGKKRETACL